MNGFGSYEAFEAEGGRFLTCYRPPAPPMPPIDEVWEALHRGKVSSQRILLGFHFVRPHHRPKRCSCSRSTYQRPYRK
jgi:hypothetical protein